MRPAKPTPVHRTADFAELVCSNSLRSDAPINAHGLLKKEMRRMGSLVMEAADAARVPAGQALAVDRAIFSRYIGSNGRLVFRPWTRSGKALTSTSAAFTPMARQDSSFATITGRSS